MRRSLSTALALMAIASAGQTSAEQTIIEVKPHPKRDPLRKLTGVMPDSSIAAAEAGPRRPVSSRRKRNRKRRGWR